MNREASEMRSTRAPDNASPDMIESALSSNREAIDHTLTEIQERLSAEGLMNQVMERLRSESGTEFLRGLRSSVVHNPVPITVIALGMAWAALSERSGPRAAGIAEREERQPGRARERASASLRAARERTRALAGRGREGLEQTRERAGGPGQGAVARSRESVSRGWAFTREHPVLMAGAGIAVGAAVAAMLPTTRVERERLGPVRDETLRGGTRFASEAGRGAATGVSEEHPTGPAPHATEPDQRPETGPRSAETSEHSTEPGEGPAERRI